MTIEKKTFRSGPFAAFIAQAVQVKDTLYVSGQVGMDGEGNVPEGVSAQAARAYQNLNDVLSEFGATMDNIVDETFFCTDVADLMANVDAVYTVREVAYGGTPETTQTVVQVGALVDPRLVLEIKCIAHL